MYVMLFLICKPWYRSNPDNPQNFFRDAFLRMYFQVWTY